MTAIKNVSMLRELRKSDDPSDTLSINDPLVVLHTAGPPALGHAWSVALESLDSEGIQISPDPSVLIDRIADRFFRTGYRRHGFEIQRSELGFTCYDEPCGFVLAEFLLENGLSRAGLRKAMYQVFNHDNPHYVPFDEGGTQEVQFPSEEERKRREEEL